MTLSELQSLTGIEENELIKYQRNGLIGESRQGVITFTDSDAKTVGLVRTLFSVGLTSLEIKVYCLYLKTGQRQSAVALLKNYRNQLLSNIHVEQKNLDILDSIINQTQKSFKE